MAEGKKLHPLINWAYHFMVHISHNVIADTRGHWLACRYIAIGCIAAALVLVRAGFIKTGTLFGVVGFLFGMIYGNWLKKREKAAKPG